jgi:hypothetical protein
LSIKNAGNTIAVAYEDKIAIDSDSIEATLFSFFREKYKARAKKEIVTGSLYGKSVYMRKVGSLVLLSMEKEGQKHNYPEKSIHGVLCLYIYLHPIS